MADSRSALNEQARRLFAPLGPTYDRYGALLSFGQDPRWRRFLVSRVGAGRDDVVLDVATGTGAVAAELVRRTGCFVVGVDQSEEMLEVARRRVLLAGEAARIRLLVADAQRLELEPGSFDALTFTYLLRYVDDPAATLVSLARFVKPGGTIAALEFGVPPRPVWRALWELYVRVGLPLAGRAAGREWGDVGRYLGPSIRGFYERWPLERQLAAWREAGVRDVQFRRLSLGGGIVFWGRRS